MTEDLSKSEASRKVVLITVAESVETSQLDSVLAKLYESAEKLNTNTLMALTGTFGKAANERLLNLAQLESIMLLDDPSTNTTNSTIPYIRYMLTPSALVGILISLFILSIFIFGIL